MANSEKTSLSKSRGFRTIFSVSNPPIVLSKNAPLKYTHSLKLQFPEFSSKECVSFCSALSPNVVINDGTMAIVVKKKLLESGEGDYLEEEILFNNLLALTMRCVMLMAANQKVAKEYLELARDYLSCIKDDSGSTPPNIQWILSHIEKVLKDVSSVVIKPKPKNFHEDIPGNVGVDEKTKQLRSHSNICLLKIDRKPSSKRRNSSSTYLERYKGSLNGIVEKHW